MQIKGLSMRIFSKIFSKIFSGPTLDWNTFRMLVVAFIITIWSLFHSVRYKWKKQTSVYAKTKVLVHFKWRKWKKWTTTQGTVGKHNLNKSYRVASCPTFSNTWTWFLAYFFVLSSPSVILHSASTGEEGNVLLFNRHSLLDKVRHETKLGPSERRNLDRTVPSLWCYQV